MSTGTMRDDSKGLTATTNFLDDAGQPTTPDDVPQWSCTDTTIATVVPAADGLSCQVLPATPAKIGNATVNVVSTNTDGTQLTGAGDVTVTAGEAKSVEITFTSNP